jgi:hypothetical protein
MKANEAAQDATKAPSGNLDRSEQMRSLSTRTPACSFVTIPTGFRFST